MRHVSIESTLLLFLLISNFLDCYNAWQTKKSSMQHHSLCCCTCLRKFVIVLPHVNYFYLPLMAVEKHYAILLGMTRTVLYFVHESIVNQVDFFFSKKASEIYDACLFYK